MAYAFVQQAQAAAISSATTRSTGNISVTEGNLLVVRVRSNPARVHTLADTAGNTWTRVGNTGSQLETRWYAFANATGTTNITATFDTGPSASTIYAAEYSGLAAFSGTVANVQPSPGTSADGVTSGSITPKMQPAAMIAFSANTSGSAAPAAGTGMTSRDSVWNLISANFARPADKRLTSLDSDEALFTASTNSNHATDAMVFVETAAPATDFSDDFARIETLDLPYQQIGAVDMVADDGVARPEDASASPAIAVLDLVPLLGINPTSLIEVTTEVEEVGLDVSNPANVSCLLLDEDNAGYWLLTERAADGTYEWYVLAMSNLTTSVDTVASGDYGVGGVPAFSAGAEMRLRITGEATVDAWIGGTQVLTDHDLTVDFAGGLSIRYAGLRATARETAATEFRSIAVTNVELSLAVPVFRRHYMTMQKR